MKKSPLRYPGGKSRAIKFLINYLPEFKEFREVFFGGGSLSFYLSQKFPDKTYKASDLNYELYCFWKQLQVAAAAVVDEVQKMYDEYKAGLDGKELFNKLVSRRETNITELQRAVDFYILNRITFSGVVDSGGYSQGSFEGRFTQSSIDRLTETANIIQHIQFYCEDYRFLLEQPGKEVFIFLDPPYYSATKSKLYGKNGILHTEFNHEEMLQALKQCKHKWLITYDNSSFIQDLYKDFFQVEWKLQYGMTNSNNSASRLGNELLIANYDLEEVFKKHTKNKR
jgi:DNA adenine methylase